MFNGASWSPVGSPIETAGSSVYSFQLAGYNAQYIATWSQEIAGVNSIFANAYTSSGWSNVQALETGAGAARDPNISVNQLDGITVVWNQVSTDGVDSASYTNAFDGATWRGEQTLAAATYGGSSYNPELLSNGNGEVLAFWTQSRSGTYALYANIYRNGAWGIPEVLTDTVGRWDMQAQAATDGNGFALIWCATDGETCTSIYASIYDGTRWSEAEEVDDSSLNGPAYIINPVGLKAIESNGNGYMLVYTQTDGTGQTNAYARQYDGTAWDSPTILNDPTNDPTLRYTPQIVTNGTTYLATWVQSDGTSNSLYSSEFNDKAWGSAQLIENAIFDMARAVSDGINYLATWLQYSGGAPPRRVWGSFYSSSSGSWGTPVGLDEGVNKVDDIAHVVSGGSGFAVVWQERTGLSAYTIKVNLHDGTTWTGVTTLDDGSSGRTWLDPYSSSSAAGDNFAVFWGRDNGTAYDLFASVYDGTSWSAGEALESGAGGVTEFQLAGDGDGFLAAWRQDDGSGTYDIVSNRWTNSAGWGGEEILDEGSSSAFDLHLTGDRDGYYSIWNQPEPGGDEAVRFPWAKVMF